MVLVSVVEVVDSTPPGCELVVDDVVDDFDWPAGVESPPPPQPAARSADATVIERSRFIRAQATKAGPAYLPVP